MNYQAIGEYHAYRIQARDAAGRRFALLRNLATQVHNLAENQADMAALRATLEQVELAEREMHAAIKRANEAAALCAEQAISAKQISFDV
ncbi:hypothetical protein [Nitrosomonas halophila]|uniref:Uncharacterized protein n=1 Tax=Nitrosomonas halophila TaxID=44576 RepID=A0A1H3FDS7_9PROT|nr:hypothetical protein [Nitrosomonas halophila]SDX89126.1 hypothetical protein SAMN05421881_101163 [Nitrosomonas halophila]